MQLFTAALVAALFATDFQQVESAPDFSSIPVSETPQELQESGRILVGYKIAQDPASRRVEASNFVSETLARVRDDTGLSDCNTEPSYASFVDTAGFEVFDVGPGNEQVVMKALLDADSEDLIAYVQPDYIVYPVAMPNDPYVNYAYHHGVMSMYDAWDISTGSSLVTIGVCDTGIELTHPDLEDNMLEGYNAVTQQWGGDISTAFDNLHGTLVAGLPAAIGNNNEGIAGVGWKFKHRVGQVATEYPGLSSSSVIADCIQKMCQKKDVKVVNVSWSGVNDHARYVVAEECRNEYKTLVVNAAGNENTLLTGDSNDDSIIFVGATNSLDQRASFSNYGELVDVWAPGESVLTTGWNNWYNYVSGTSFAAPLVAGVIGLIWSVDPKLTPDEVEAILKQTCDQLPALGGLGGEGRVNAFEALKVAAGQATLAPTTPPVCDEELVIDLVTEQYPFQGIRIAEGYTGRLVFERAMYDYFDCYTSGTMKVPGLCKDQLYTVEFTDFLDAGWEGGSCTVDASIIDEYIFPGWTCSNDYKKPFMKGSWNDKTLFYLSDFSGYTFNIDFALRDCTGAGGKSTKSPKRRVRKNRIRKN